MSPPRDSDHAERELVRHLAQFRQELKAAGDDPERAALERLIARVAELGLPEDDVSEELAQLRACIDALELKAALSHGELPSFQGPDLSTPGDVCHFVCPVRFGRRRADQFGHLVLSASWLQFRGALDVSVAWSQIAGVRRERRDILVVLQESTRALRFSCHSHREAARGAVIAEYLAGVAHGDAKTRSREYHASA